MILDISSICAKNIYAVSIHDAIVVLDVPENKDVKPEDIFDDIVEVYRKYYLIPSVKTEYFRPEQATAQLHQLNENKEGIQAFKDDLENMCADTNHPKHQIAMNINGAIERGEYFLKMGNEHVYLDRNTKYRY